MKQTVLFLCTGNSCRSQMAEGWLRKLAGDRFKAVSAGIRPAGLNPLAVQVMKELDVDISQQRSKDVAEFSGSRFNAVITVCDHAKEACPIFPGGGKVLHWSFEDPAEAEGSEEERMRVFRRVRDEIGSNITAWLKAVPQPIL